VSARRQRGKDCRLHCKSIKASLGNAGLRVGRIQIWRIVHHPVLYCSSIGKAGIDAALAICSVSPIHHPRDSDSLGPAKGGSYRSCRVPLRMNVEDKEHVTEFKGLFSFSFSNMLDFYSSAVLYQAPQIHFSSDPYRQSPGREIQIATGIIMCSYSAPKRAGEGFLLPIATYRCVLLTIQYSHLPRLTSNTSTAL
jgi:hypothetical protein